MWNQQLDREVVIAAELRDIAAGSADHRVRGSGIFVGGHGDWNGAADGGTLRVATLTPGEIHADGGIPAGTPDLISGGVFVISGAFVDEVLNNGSVTTCGPNDVVLDNWGSVRSWVASAPVVSYEPGGVGFVNFGQPACMGRPTGADNRRRGRSAWQPSPRTWRSVAMASSETIAATGRTSIGAGTLPRSRRQTCLWPTCAPSSAASAEDDVPSYAHVRPGPEAVAAPTDEHDPVRRRRR